MNEDAKKKVGELRLAAGRLERAAGKPENKTKADEILAALATLNERIDGLVAALTTPAPDTDADTDADDLL